MYMLKCLNFRYSFFLLLYLLAHSNVLYSYPVSTLVSAGYTVCYSEPYSTATTTTALSACYGGTSYFVGAISPSSPSTFRLGAFGTPRIFTATYSTTTAYLDPAGVHWYDYSGRMPSDSQILLLLL